jgi:uncharacterized Zn-finger protein
MPQDKPITVTKPERVTAPVKLGSADLLGHGVVACPNPRMPLWSNHPRVFIDLSKTGAASCPYCGTTYQLDGGSSAGHGH